MRLVILFIASFLFFTVVFSLLSRQSNVAEGYVTDCESNIPVEGAQVSLNERGWGFRDGQLVWDKDYAYTALTTKQGFFQIIYKGNPTDIKATKSGYLLEQKYETPSKNVSLKMLRGDMPTEVTYDCKLSKECLVTIVDHGVQITKNVCTSE